VIDFVVGIFGRLAASRGPEKTWLEALVLDQERWARHTPPFPQGAGSVSAFHFLQKRVEYGVSRKTNLNAIDRSAVAR